MNIADLRIDNFGVWSGLELNQLSSELTVLYGPNETGKTTLLEFVRAMFYGFDAARQDRYLPAVQAGIAGGSLLVQNSHKDYRIVRHDGPSAPSAGLLSILDARGDQHEAQVLDELLAGVDESIYRNVFAVGLDELQQLRTLSDGDASNLLYDLSIGLDRVSLVEVIRELKQSRGRMLSAEDRPSQIAQLIAQRSNLQGGIEELAGQANRYWQIATSRDGLAREATAAEENVAELEGELRLLETASTVRDRWQERRTVEGQLASLGEVQELPVDGVARLGALHSRIRKNRRRYQLCRRKRKALRLEVETLPLNESLWRQSARIEALAENEPWIASLESQLKESDAEVARLNAQINDQGGRLGLGANGRPGAALNADSRWLVPLKAASASLKQARRRMLAAKAETTGNRASADALRQEIEKTLSKRSETDLNGAMERTGQLVSQLRRRIQIDDRLDQMARNKTELQESIQDSLDQQVLPAWQLATIGSGIVIGVTLFLVGLFNLVFPGFFPGNPGALVIFGPVMAVAAGVAKWFLEHAAEEQLDADQKQLAMLKVQMGQAKVERDALDEQLPSGGGHMVTRLQKAEKELAVLEELLPINAKAQLAEQQSATEKQRLEDAVKDYKTASKRWKQALASAGLPENVTPGQLRDLANHGDVMGDLQRKLDQRRLESETRKKEQHAFQSRIAGLFSAAGLTPEGPSLTTQLRQLRKSVAAQEALFKKRDELLGLASKYRKRQRKCRSEIVRLTRRRRSLMKAAGAFDEADFKRRVQMWAQVDELRSRHESLQAEIAASLGSFSPTTIEERLGQADGESIGQTIAIVRGKLDAAQRTLRAIFERRGDLGAQLKLIAEDRKLGQKRLELASVKKRLQEAIERWQVLGITEVTLEDIKQKYETDRQPEALREASEYLARLTEGKYRRVWTPVDVHELKVEDRSGHSLPVEVLSRGTREQLFLALRLAIVSSYAKRGAALPLVLDDVLVNFDVERATAAAELLQDFAGAGHQLLVFTCHEHISNIFRTLRADCRPLRTGARSMERLEPPTPKKKKRVKPMPVEPEPEELVPVMLAEPVPEITVPEITEAITLREEPEPTLELPVPEAEVEPVLAQIEDLELELVDDGLPPPAPAKLERLPEIKFEVEIQSKVVHVEPVSKPEPKLARYAAPPRVEPARRPAKKPRRAKAGLVGWGNRWDAEEFAGELADRVDPNWSASQILEAPNYAETTSDRLGFTVGDEDSEAA